MKTFSSIAAEACLKSRLRFGASYSTRRLARLLGPRTSSRSILNLLGADTRTQTSCPQEARYRLSNKWPPSNKKGKHLLAYD
jgi:hypothetical protein